MITCLLKRIERRNRGQLILDTSHIYFERYKLILLYYPSFHILHHISHCIAHLFYFFIKLIWLLMKWYKFVFVKQKKKSHLLWEIAPANVLVICILFLRFNWVFHSFELLNVIFSIVRVLVQGEILEEKKTNNKISKWWGLYLINWI